MDEKSIERALKASLSILLVLSILDFYLYITLETVVFTVIANAISVFLLFKYRLNFDIVKILEIFAFFTDLLIIYFFGFALVSAFTSLISIIIVLFKKEKHMKKLKIDIEKILSSKEKEL